MNPARRARGLTPRGWALLVAGAVLLVAGMLGLGAVAIQAGALVVSLTLIAIATCVLPALDLTVRRSLHPEVLGAGEAVRVRLTVEGSRRLPLAISTVTDLLPPSLGDPRRSPLRPRGKQWQHRVSYVLRPRTRGSYVIGPAQVELRDPFGLTRQRIRSGSESLLLVTPRLHHLSNHRAQAGWSADGAGRRPAIASVGPDDAAVRPYVDGDDRRRIHWRATARHDAVMVRHEERPRESSILVLLDTRPGHFQTGEPRTEWLVEACASIAAHLQERGMGVGVMTTAGTCLHQTLPGEAGRERDALQALATVEVEEGANIGHAAEIVHGYAAGSSQIIFLTDGLSLPDAEILRPAGREANTITLLPPDGDERTDAALDALSWHFARAREGEQIDAVWSRYTGTGAMAGL